MAQDKEPFISRWSRVKHERAAEKPAQESEPERSEAPALPPVAQLTPESDFSVFMHPKVQDALRRVALKKLFSDPHFNVADPFEAYSGDWTGGEAISEELLAKLNQARSVLFRDEPKQAEEQPQQIEAARAAGTEQDEGAKEDEPGRKDA
jgi:hypothetical protein